MLHDAQQKQQHIEQQQNLMQRSNADGTLSPTSNQLARWFSPELLAQASAGKLPKLPSVSAQDEFEQKMNGKDE